MKDYRRLEVRGFKAYKDYVSITILALVYGPAKLEEDVSNIKNALSSAGINIKSMSVTVGAYGYYPHKILVKVLYD